MSSSSRGVNGEAPKQMPTETLPPDSLTSPVQSKGATAAYDDLFGAPSGVPSSWQFSPGLLSGIGLSPTTGYSPRAGITTVAMEDVPWSPSGLSVADGIAPRTPKSDNRSFADMLSPLLPLGTSPAVPLTDISKIPTSKDWSPFVGGFQAVGEEFCFSELAGSPAARLRSSGMVAPPRYGADNGLSDDNTRFQNPFSPVSMRNEHLESNKQALAARLSSNNGSIGIAGRNNDAADWASSAAGGDGKLGIAEGNNSRKKSANGGGGGSSKHSVNKSLFAEGGGMSAAGEGSSSSLGGGKAGGGGGAKSTGKKSTSSTSSIMASPPRTLLNKWSKADGGVKQFPGMAGSVSELVLQPFADSGLLRHQAELAAPNGGGANSKSNSKAKMTKGKRSKSIDGDGDDEMQERIEAAAKSDHSKLATLTATAAAIAPVATFSLTGSSASAKSSNAHPSFNTRPTFSSPDSASSLASASGSFSMGGSASSTPYISPPGVTVAAGAGGGANKPVTCNCKRSRCLKLYCDCFRFSKYCFGCRCIDCANSGDREDERKAAIAAICERNPDSFKPRVSDHNQFEGHFMGCHCKRSNCLKKYCECFTMMVPCAERCRCQDCKNSPDIYRDVIKKPAAVAVAATAAAPAATPAAAVAVPAGVGSDEKLKWNTGKVESEERKKWSAAEAAALAEREQKRNWSADDVLATIRSTSGGRHSRTSSFSSVPASATGVPSILTSSGKSPSSVPRENVITSPKAEKGETVGSSLMRHLSIRSATKPEGEGGLDDSMTSVDSTVENAAATIGALAAASTSNADVAPPASPPRMQHTSSLSLLAEVSTPMSTRRSGAAVAGGTNSPPHSRAKEIMSPALLELAGICEQQSEAQESMMFSPKKLFSESAQKLPAAAAPHLQQTKQASPLVSPAKRQAVAATAGTSASPTVSPTRASLRQHRPSARAQEAAAAAAAMDVVEDESTAAAFIKKEKDPSTLKSPLRTASSLSSSSSASSSSSSSTAAMAVAAASAALSAVAATAAAAAVLSPLRSPKRTRAQLDEDHAQSESASGIDSKVAAASVAGSVSSPVKVKEEDDGGHRAKRVPTSAAAAAAAAAAGKSTESTTTVASPVRVQPAAPVSVPAPTSKAKPVASKASEPPPPPPAAAIEGSAAATGRRASRRGGDEHVPAKADSVVDAPVTKVEEVQQQQHAGKDSQPCTQAGSGLNDAKKRRGSREEKALIADLEEHARSRKGTQAEVKVEKVAATGASVASTTTTTTTTPAGGGKGKGGSAVKIKKEKGEKDVTEIDARDDGHTHDDDTGGGRRRSTRLSRGGEAELETVKKSTDKPKTR